MMEASLNFSMYPPETLTLKEFFECDYDQPEMGPFYSQSTSAFHPVVPDMATDHFENPFGTPPQSACYDMVPVGGNFSPVYDKPTTPSYTPEEQAAVTQLYGPTGVGFSPHKSTPSPVSSTLPTPPQSPPSTENDLDNIIATFPEILEFPPTFLFPAVEDVLFDLETIPCSTSFAIPSVFEDHHLSRPQDQLDRRENSGQMPKALKKDSMWGGSLPFMTADDHRLKTRTVSESSEEYRHHSVYSDEEYDEHLPDSPCVSDEDVEHLDAKELSSNLNNITSATTSSFDQPRVPSFINVISSDHNYCGKFPSESGSKNADTANPPNSPSTQVKRQLQLAIQESLNNKQKRGRVGRPPKVLKTSPVSSPGLPFSIDVVSDTSSAVLKCHTQGKPASYTRRMREQHTEILKTNKKRRTMSKDPECEFEKRSNHNIMERNRRVNIKNLFDMLRQNVPEIHDNERASKVLILNKSRDYIEQNERSSLRLEYEYTTEKERNLMLKRRLQALQAHH